MKWISARRFNQSAMRVGLINALAVGLLLASPAQAAAPGPDGNRGHLSRLLHNQKVIDHLGLTVEQASAAQSVSNAAVEHHRSDFDKALEAPERAERVPQVAQVFVLTDARAHEGLKTVLSPHQLQRLQQIQLYTLAMRAFTRADVAQQLELSAAQQQAFNDLTASAGAKLSGIQRSQTVSAADKSQQVRQVRAEALEQVQQQLSAAQWLQWELLSGAAFTQ